MGAMSIQRTTRTPRESPARSRARDWSRSSAWGRPTWSSRASTRSASLLTLGDRAAGAAHHARDDAGRAARPSPWRDLKEGLAYVWSTPILLAMMWLAFLVNLTAFPLLNGLLPYVAKDVYRTDQTGLGYLVASFAAGALLGSIVLSQRRRRIPPARMMIVCGAALVLDAARVRAHAAPARRHLLPVARGLRAKLCRCRCR